MGKGEKDFFFFYLLGRPTFVVVLKEVGEGGEGTFTQKCVGGKRETVTLKELYPSLLHQTFKVVCSPPSPPVLQQNRGYPFGSFKIWSNYPKKTAFCFEKKFLSSGCLSKNVTTIKWN